MEKWKREELTEKIINACINVHKELGPGFLENIYHNALKFELERLKLAFESEKEIEVKYLDMVVGIHRIDLLVEDEKELILFSPIPPFLPFTFLLFLNYEEVYYCPRYTGA